MLKSQSFQSRSLPDIITILLLILWAAMVYRSSINSFPSHVHAWTQSDRFALTIGYLDNGFNLFKPSTPNLWPKYPPKQMPEKLEGVSKADLPLTEYLAAQLMRLTGIRQPVFHRGLNLCIVLFGIFLLFKLMRRMGSSLPMAWLGLGFTMLSPVFAYYIDGFIPGIPALGLLMAAYYFFYRYSETGKERFMVFSLSLATLAALIRPPMLMALPAMLFAVLLSSPRKQAIRILSGGAIAFLLFGAFQLYNHHLAANYGSLFISGLMPAESPAALLASFALSLKRWKLEYFSFAHYLLLSFAVLLIILFRHKLRSKPSFSMLVAALAQLAAAAAYFVVMAKQFPDHDYYFLESFFLPLVLICVIGLSLPQADKLLRKIVFSVVLMLTTWLMADAALANREKRYTTQAWDLTEKTRQLFEGSSVWLDNIGISHQAKILVLDSYTTNVPLLLMERRGFTVINTTKDNLESSLGLPFDYIVIPNRSLPSDVLRNLPSLAAWLQPVANNGRIGLYGIDRTGTEKQIAALTLPVRVESKLAIDSLIRIGPDSEFAEIINIPYQPSEDIRALVFGGLAHTGLQQVKDLHLVVDISSPRENHFYESFCLDPYFERPVQASPIGAYINLPNPEKDGSMLKCYLWNAGRNQMEISHPTLDILHYDNLKIHKQ